jgi:hypothetical protein
MNVASTSLDKIEILLYSDCTNSVEQFQRNGPSKHAFLGVSSTFLDKYDGRSSASKEPSDHFRFLFTFNHSQLITTLGSLKGCLDSVHL